jgi:hypothetical protein
LPANRDQTDNQLLGSLAGKVITILYPEPGATFAVGCERSGGCNSNGDQRAPRGHKDRRTDVLEHLKEQDAFGIGFFL